MKSALFTGVLLSSIALASCGQQKKTPDLDFKSLKIYYKEDSTTLRYMRAEVSANDLIDAKTKPTMHCDLEITNKSKIAFDIKFSILPNETFVFDSRKDLAVLKDGTQLNSDDVFNRENHGTLTCVVYPSEHNTKPEWSVANQIQTAGL